MKITKTRLKEIIKEELERELKENLSTAEQERRRELKLSLKDDRAFVRQMVQDLNTTETGGLRGKDKERFEAACKRLENSGITKYKNYFNCMDMILPMGSRYERIKEAIKEELDLMGADIENISGEYGSPTTEPRYDVGSPEQKLINALWMRGVLDRMSPEERMELAGGDPEVEELIRDLLSRRMLDNPGL